MSPKDLTLVVFSASCRIGALACFVSPSTFLLHQPVRIAAQIKPLPGISPLSGINGPALWCVGIVIIPIGDPDKACL